MPGVYEAVCGLVVWLYGELLVTVAPRANAHPLSSYRSLCSQWIALYGTYPTLAMVVITGLVCFTQEDG